MAQGENRGKNRENSREKAMKSIISCVGSGIVGALAALALTEVDWRPQAVALPQAGAQEVRRAGQGAPGDRLDGPVVHRPARSKRAAAAPVAHAARGQEPAGPLGPDELSVEEQINIAVYENVNRGVVHITTRGVRSEGFFLLDVPTEGAGSGSILDASGHILTNNHVIEGARQVAVTLFDGTSYEARFVGADPINDIAVVRIEAPAGKLFPVTFGDSRPLKVGMRVFAIGNPFGLERTLTTGIISSLNRTLAVHENRTIKSIIQTDAAINPGSSGGPLLDAHGRLIGMNTAIASKTGQSAGVGFAIPVSLIARVVPQLIEKGRIIRPEIGIAKVYETESGLLVMKLVPDGPAQRAGIKGPAVITRRRGPFIVESIDRSAADLIVAVDGQKIKTADEFLSVIEAKQPGARVVLTIIRQNAEVQVPVVLGGDLPDSPADKP
jgi:S1-C subfamily serine protease